MSNTFTSNSVLSTNVLIWKTIIMKIAISFRYRETYQVSILTHCYLWRGPAFNVRRDIRSNESFIVGWGRSSWLKVRGAGEVRNLWKIRLNHNVRSDAVFCYRVGVVGELSSRWVDPFQSGCQVSVVYCYATQGQLLANKNRISGRFHWIVTFCKRCHKRFSNIGQVYDCA